MSSYQIGDITVLPERLQGLLGCEVELPTPGEARDLHVLHISGWAVGRESPASELEVVQDGRVVRVVPIRGGREDVAATVGVPVETDCVFHALVNLVGLKLEGALRLQVVLKDGSRVGAASLNVSRSPLRPSFEPALQPLMVTTLGRSGSTWLMQLLATHPKVLVFRHFPYESSSAKYWLHMLRVLSEPANLVQSALPHDFHEHRWWLGANPYHDDRIYEQEALQKWFGNTYIEHLADFCCRSIEEWYMTLSGSQLQPDPVYFAEKHVRPDDLPDLTWELYPDAKEVFLVRDFRDMASSILAFDAKRGFAGFGRPHGVSDEEYLRGDLRQMADDLVASWRARADRAHLVRYEDLALQPAETLASMLDYLNLERSRERVSEMLEVGFEPVLWLAGTSFEVSEVRSHRTVPDVRDTVGRWRRDGDDRFRALADEIFGEALAAFGYT